MTRGVVYFHFNRSQFFKDCLVKSITSLRAKMPGLPVTFFGPFTQEDFAGICEIEEIVTIDMTGKDPWSYKLELLRDHHYEQTLFMDSDTLFVEPVWELFDMLERFDLVATLEHHYLGKLETLAPVCFPELNYGMFLWRKNEETREFFDSANRIRTSIGRRGCDQPCFRIALWESKIRYAVVPWEYNCRYYYPGYLFRTAKILHSHSGNIEEDEKIINEKVYADYPPFKRLFTGDRIFLLKKIKGTHSVMKIEKETKYR
jgi:hypothetical protein